LSGDNPDGILSYKGEYVQYVSDIQQIFRKNGKELSIEEDSLKAACELLSQHQKFNNLPSLNYLPSHVNVI